MSLLKNMMISASILTLFTSSLAAKTVVDTWELVSDEDDVASYIKPNSEGGLVSIRGIGTVSATTQQTLKVLQNLEETPQWSPYLSEIRVLEDRGNAGLVTYIRMAAPWPVSDRYFITIRTVEQLADGGFLLRQKSVEHPRAHWLHDDQILGTMNYSSIQVNPSSDGQGSKIVMESSSDPKGDIPQAIINRSQRSAALDFFRGLRQQIRKKIAQGSL